MDNYRKAYLKIRQALGVMGCVLPLIVLGIGCFFGRANPQNWWYSISATFYTNAGTVFTGIMICVGIVLIVYPGYSWTDYVANIGAGVMAICVALFPCNAGFLEPSYYVGTFGLHPELSNIPHCASAGILFVCLAFNIAYNFTKSGEPVEQKSRKWYRNMFYYICAAAIAAGMVSQTLCSIFNAPGWMTMVNEAEMLFFFGVAWLVKGEAIKKLND